MSERLVNAAIANVNKLKGLEEEKAGSPIIDAILIIGPIIYDLISGCFSDPEKAAWRARNPGLGGRLRLRREVTRQFPGSDDDDREARSIVFQAMIDAGQLATADDFTVN